MLSIVFSLSFIHNSWGYGFDRVVLGNGAVVDVEVASTPAQLARGLMYRESLADGSGMFFVFESEGRHGFWMKNMEFPIDILWLDSDLRVVDITENVPPCRSDPCEIYRPDVPSRYVLEVPAGFVVDSGVAVGQTVSLGQKSGLQ